MTPEQFRVSYIKLDAATMQQPVSDADIQSYYDQHQDQFTQPQRTRYSIIQTKTEDEAKAVLDELNKGGDFAALAKEKSADIISARNGGDMGWLEDATIPDETEKCGSERKRPTVWCYQIFGRFPDCASGRHSASESEIVRRST